MMRVLSPYTFTALVLCVAISACAQTPDKNLKPKISMQQARESALAKEPGTIQTGELEAENGKLIYSFDIRTKAGAIHEVNIDAVTGKLVDDSIESPQAEASELRSEAKPGPASSSAARRSPTPSAGSVPASVTDVGEYAENVYDAAKAGQWSTAETKLKSLRQSAANIESQVPGSGAQGQKLQSALAALDKSISARSKEAAMRESNQITLIAVELAAGFHPAVPGDVTRLDYYGRELEVAAMADDLTGWNSTTGDTWRTWERVRPQVQSHGGAIAAKRFDAVLSGVEKANTPSARKTAAAAELEHVDELEKVFTRP